MQPDATDPEDHAPAIRSYLGRFLPLEAHEAALQETMDEARYWRDRELEDVMRAAQRSVHARTAPDPREEAATMVAVCRVDPAAAARLTGVDERRIRLDHQALVALSRPRADLRRTGSRAPDTTPRQELILKVGIGVLALVVVASFIGLLTQAGDDEPAPPELRGFEITGLEVVADDGSTAGPFPRGERLRLRIDYSPTGQEVTVEMSIVGPAGSTILEADVRLPRVRDRIDVPIPGRLLDVPGEHRAEIHHDEAEPATATFIIAD